MGVHFLRTQKMFVEKPIVNLDDSLLLYVLNRTKHFHLHQRAWWCEHYSIERIFNMMLYKTFNVLDEDLYRVRYNGWRGDQIYKQLALGWEHHSGDFMCPVPPPKGFRDAIDASLYCKINTNEEYRLSQEMLLDYIIGKVSGNPVDTAA